LAVETGEEQMNLTDPKLVTLAESEGHEPTEDGVMEMLQEAMKDSVCPGICTHTDCDGVQECEPDARHNPCELCGRKSVASGLVLAGVI